MFSQFSATPLFLLALNLDTYIIAFGRSYVYFEKNSICFVTLVICCGFWMIEFFSQWNQLRDGDSNLILHQTEAPLIHYLVATVAVLHEYIYRLKEIRKVFTLTLYGYLFRFK